MNKNRIGQIFFNDDRSDRDQDSKQVGWANYGFSRDLSRIIFSNSYRRMAGKTQIFPAYSNEHLMTRLTHTLIVNNIAMDIAQRVNNNNEFYKINLDLIQAIANGHDIGHTPFGHAGERKLNELSKSNKFNKEYYFKHNVFSVNVLQNLDKIKSLDYGYDLSWQVVDGILKHSDLPKIGENKEVFTFQLNHSFFKSNTLKKALNQINSIEYCDYPFPLTIEGQIVKIADEIAQYYHDVLDLSRYFKDREIIKDFIDNIFSNAAIKELNKKSNELSEYEEKFIRTFTDAGMIKEEKLFDIDNREFFANEIKELFINDVVENIIKKESINTYILGNNSNRFIVENILFTLKNDKVVPKFKSNYVEKVSEIFIDYRKKMITEDKNILLYDNEGKINIGITLEKIISNKKLFKKYCSKDIIQYLNKIKRNNFFKLKINGLDVTEENFKDKKEEIVDNIYEYVVKKDQNCIFFSDEMNDIINNLFYGVVIEAIARMTDNYILQKKYELN